MSAQIFPIVGAAPLVLPDPLPTQDVSDGTPGAATPDTAIQVAGTDGTDLRTILTDTSGRQEVVGAAASGAAVTGNPVLVAGSDGTDARTLLTDNTGQLKVLVENGSAIAVSGTVTAEIEGHAGGVLDAVLGATKPANVLQVGGNDGTNAYAIPMASGGASVIVSGTVTPAKTSQSPSAPTQATVGASSALALASNSSRTGLVLVNTSANTISIAFGANAAVLNSGITLNPNGGTFVMDAFTFTTQAVNAIAGAASSNLAIQELA
jgi:hypothetical protein